MVRSLVSTVVLALGAATSVWASQPANQPRAAVGKTNHHHRNGHLHARHRAPAPKRHDYLRHNSTFAPQLAQRNSKGGRATFYHPASEGGSQSSCGKYMNDNTMGVALSQVGWKYFANKGISEKELCYKSITVHGLLGEQKAQIWDQCPSDDSTGTCVDICDIDLTYGLFGLVAHHDSGIVPISWSFDDGTENPCNKKGTKSGSSGSSDHHSSSSNKSSSSQSSSPSSSHSDSNTEQNQNHWGEKSSSSSYSPSHSSHSSASPSSSSSSSSSSSNKSSKGSQSSNTKSEFKTDLQWWESIDSQYCPGIHIPQGSVTAAVGPNDHYSEAKLKDSCGKWISITNNQGKTSKAIVTMWIPEQDQNFLAIDSDFKAIVGSSDSDSVSWSFEN